MHVACPVCIRRLIGDRPFKSMQNLNHVQMCNADQPTPSLLARANTTHTQDRRWRGVEALNFLRCPRVRHVRAFRVCITQPRENRLSTGCLRSQYKLRRCAGIGQRSTVKLSNTQHQSKEYCVYCRKVAFLIRWPVPTKLSSIATITAYTQTRACVRIHTKKEDADCRFKYGVISSHNVRRQTCEHTRARAHHVSTSSHHLCSSAVLTITTAPTRHAVSSFAVGAYCGTNVR